MGKKIKAFLNASYGTAIGLWAIIFIMIFIVIFLEILKSFGLSLFVDSDNFRLVLTFLVTFGLALYIYNIQVEENEEKETKKQIDLLEVLFEELNFLEKNLNSYKETFSERKGYPLWELWDIDVSIYFKNLSHRINNYKTIKLKKNLMKIKDKLLVINNLKIETKKLEETRGQEKIIKELGIIKINRKQIAKFIEEILPVIKTSKHLCKKFSV